MAYFRNDLGLEKITHIVHGCIHFCDMEITTIEVRQPLNKSLENYVKVSLYKNHETFIFKVFIYASANKSNLHP